MTIPQRARLILLAATILLMVAVALAMPGCAGTDSATTGGVMSHGAAAGKVVYESEVSKYAGQVLPTEVQTDSVLYFGPPATTFAINKETGLPVYNSFANLRAGIIEITSPNGTALYAEDVQTVNPDPADQIEAFTEQVRELNQTQRALIDALPGILAESVGKALRAALTGQ